MRKTILFLLVLTFFPIAEGADRKKGAELILQNLLEKERSEGDKTEANSTASKKVSIEIKANKDKPEKDSDKKKFPVSAWVGYGYYAMSEFNRKLSGEGNDTIDGGLNVGIEVPLKSAKVGILGFDLSSFPIGIEYLEARSETTHTNGGTCISVDWELPVVGIYFWPEVEYRKLPEKWMDGKGWDVRLRPMGVGYYTLGKIMDAELDVSDSPGYLEVEDETIGIMSQIGIKYVIEKETFEAFVEGGYRWLKFTSVMRKPKGGFAGGSPSTMPEDLDYSGFIIKAGLCKRF
jgi:hypothetical protein